MIDQLRQWLAIAHPAAELPRDFRKRVEKGNFEDTWAVNGREVHAKAWVVQKERFWLGVLNFYPHPVVIISGWLPNISFHRTAPFAAELGSLCGRQ